MKRREKLCWWADCCPTRLIPVQAWLSSGGSRTHDTSLSPGGTVAVLLKSAIGVCKPTKRYRTKVSLNGWDCGSILSTLAE